MRVAITMPLGTHRGGGEQMLIDLIQQGQNCGIDWLVIFLEEGPMVEQIQALGADVRVVPSGRLRQVHRFGQTIWQIAAIVKQEKIDVLVGWMCKAQLYSGLAAKLAGVPALWYQLHTPDPQSKLQQLASFIPAKGVVTLSKASQELRQQFRPHRPTRLVYPGVAVDRFDPTQLPSPIEVRKKLGLPIGVPLIGIVGRLQRWKGMHVVVEAMPQVLQHYPDAHCVIVGGEHPFEPDYLDEVKSRIGELALGDRVTITGYQSNIPEWMQAMDVIIHASDNEPFGIVVIEAMALGKPIVAGAAGGPTEIITPGVDGLLAPYGDSDSLAQAILNYLHDQTFAQRVGIAAQKRAQDFSTQNYAQNFISTLQDLALGVA